MQKKSKRSLEKTDIDSYKMTLMDVKRLVDISNIDNDKRCDLMFALDILESKIDKCRKNPDRIKKHFKQGGDINDRYRKG